MAEHAALSAASPITNNIPPPALGLPAELLRIIFLLFATHDRAHRTYPLCKSLSHVCRQWRNVALACQELWSAYLPRRSTQWTTACLTRASSVPLDIVINIDDHAAAELDSSPAEGERHEAAMSVVSRWPRIKTLDATFHCRIASADPDVLSEETQVLFDNLISVLSSPNHNLEKLSLSLQTQFDRRHWVLVDLPSGSSFRQRFQKLYHLELGYCTLLSSPDNAPIFPAHLRYLKLYNTRAWADADSMVQCLQATPMLQSLYYKFDVDPPSLESIRPSRHHQPRCIPLPHLDELSLHGFWIQSIAIFNYIAAPSWCHIRIDCCMWDEIGYLPEEIVLEHIALGCEAFKQHFAPAIYQGLTYDFVHPTHRDISAVLISSAPTEEAAVLPNSLLLSFPETEDERIQRAAYDMLLFLPIFAKTKHIFLEFHLWECYPGWYEQYTAIRTIVSFDNHCRCLDPFISALKREGEALFPMLSHIVLEDNEILNLYQLFQLVEALRNAHAATDRFRLLTLSGLDGRGFTRNVVDEVAKQLGSDRVEWLPYDKRDICLEAGLLFSSTHELKECMREIQLA